MTCYGTAQLHKLYAALGLKSPPDLERNKTLDNALQIINRVTLCVWGDLYQNDRSNSFLRYFPTGFIFNFIKIRSLATKLEHF